MVYATVASACAEDVALGGLGVAGITSAKLLVVKAVVDEDPARSPVTAHASRSVGTLNPSPSEVSTAGLPALIDDVSSSTGYRYGATDDEGSTLDTLKVLPRPGGGYLGVYHTFERGTFAVKLATSSNLLSWHHEVDLARYGAQATIAR